MVTNLLSRRSTTLKDNDKAINYFFK